MRSRLPASEWGWIRATKDRRDYRRMKLDREYESLQSLVMVNQCRGSESHARSRLPIQFGNTSLDREIIIGHACSKCEPRFRQR